METLRPRQRGLCTGPRWGALTLEEEREGAEEVWVQALALPQTIPSLAVSQNSRRCAVGGGEAVVILCTEPVVEGQKAPLWCSW